MRHTSFKDERIELAVRLMFLTWRYRHNIYNSVSWISDILIFFLTKKTSWLNVIQALVAVLRFLCLCLTPWIWSCHLNSFLTLLSKLYDVVHKCIWAVVSILRRDTDHRTLRIVIRWMSAHYICLLLAFFWKYFESRITIRSMELIMFRFLK